MKRCIATFTKMIAIRDAPEFNIFKGTAYWVSDQLFGSVVNEEGLIVYPGKRLIGYHFLQTHTDETKYPILYEGMEYVQFVNCVFSEVDQGHCCYVDQNEQDQCLLTTQTECAKLGGFRFVFPPGECPDDCEVPRGACCIPPDPPGFVCGDTPGCYVQVNFNECIDNLTQCECAAYPNSTWKPGVPCDGFSGGKDVCNPEGSCCQCSGFPCIDGVLEIDCILLHRKWTEGASCLPSPPFEPNTCLPTGACCDRIANPITCLSGAGELTVDHYRVLGCRQSTCDECGDCVWSVALDMCVCPSNSQTSSFWMGQCSECTDDGCCMPHANFVCELCGNCENCVREIDYIHQSACCFGANCVSMTECECSRNQGQWYSNCNSPVPCEGSQCPRGACCDADGIFDQCVEFDEQGCMLSNGEYQGDGTKCAEVNCQNTDLELGACCFQSSGVCPPAIPRCDMRTREQCEGSGAGIWMGPQSNCFTGPCCWMGACCLGGGECRILTEEACEGLGGDFWGPDRNCDTFLPPNC